MSTVPDSHRDKWAASTCRWPQVRLGWPRCAACKFGRVPPSMTMRRRGHTHPLGMLRGRYASHFRRRLLHTRDEVSPGHISGINLPSAFGMSQAICLGLSGPGPIAAQRTPSAHHSQRIRAAPRHQCATLLRPSNAWPCIPAALTWAGAAHGSGRPVRRAIAFLTGEMPFLCGPDRRGFSSRGSAGHLGRSISKHVLPRMQGRRSPLCACRLWD